MARTSRFFKTPLQGNDTRRVPALAMPSPSSTMPCQADEDKQHQHIPDYSVEKKWLTAKGLSSEVVARRESFQPSSGTGTVSTANLRLVSDPVSHVVDLIVERLSQSFI